MRYLMLVLALICTACSVLAETPDETLVARAKIVMADKRSDLELHGNLLAQYADSLRTMDIILSTRCLELSGIAAFRTNQMDSAITRWQRGVQRAREGKAERSEGSLLNALAIGYTAKGDVEGALPIYERSLEIREALADTMGMSRTWGNLATAYANIGRTAEALAATTEEEKWLALVDNHKGQVSNAIRKSQLLGAMGRQEEALLEGRQAVALAEKMDDDNVQGMAAMSLGNALLDLGHYDEALQVSRGAARQLRESGDEYSATFVDQSIINCLIMQDRYDDALARLEILIPKVQAADQVPLLTVLQRYKGTALFALGRVAEAEAILETAMVSFEERRDRLTDDGSRAGIFSASGELYASLARCQLVAGRMEEAFATVERGRAPVFRDHASGQVAKIADLQQELSRQGATLILFNDPVIDPLVAFVLDAKSLRTVELGMVDPLASDARAALRLLAAGESLEVCRPALDRLKGSLASPILAMVDLGSNRFYVVPPSFLAGFPLGILQGPDGRDWGESKPLNYLPNASSLLDLNARNAPLEGVLAFADPSASSGDTSRLPQSSARAQAGVPLPESRDEIKVVTKRKDNRRIGSRASGDELRAALKTPLAVLHLATHAVVDPVDGSRSAVVLAGGDGVDVVTAEEISTYNFQGDLVVLSGCSTFGEHRVLGEGWFGLPRSFLAAGARSVVSTLWDVDDYGARQFITEFYGALGRGAARDEALVQARKVCRENGMPPREWAAFVLTGLGSESLPVLMQPKDNGLSISGLALVSLLGIVCAGIWLRQRK